MRIFKSALTILILGSIVFLSLSCRSNANATSTPTPITYTVQKGSIDVTVTGTGNLAYSDSQDLAFEMAGYVEEILVNESESVTKGQELVKLDTSDWEDQIKTLEKALTTAQRALVSAQSAVTTAERTVSEKQLAIQSKQLDLETAQYYLNQITPVRIAQANVDAAKLDWDTAKALRANGESSITLAELDRLEEEYTNCLANLNEVLSGNDTTIETTVALQVAKLNLTFQSAQMALESAQIAVTSAEREVVEAKEDLVEAQENVTEAQADLDEEKAKSPIITAPFDGFITDIKVAGGDEVAKGTVALTIADPNQFEASIMVAENDIMSIKVGSEAVVTVDSYSGYEFPAKIMTIAPLATISSGVVNYKVTAKLSSLTPVRTGMGNMPLPSDLPEGFPSNLPSGPMPTNMPSGFPSNLPNQGSMGGPMNKIEAAAENISLKDGLSSTVTITTAHIENVLVIPSRGITRQNGNPTVQLVDGSTTKPIVVTTGLTDGTSTEIISGLNENDQILVKASSTTSNMFNRGFGGAGGPPPQVEMQVK